MKNSGLIATRRSLVDRLANWDDQRRRQEFFRHLLEADLRGSAKMRPGG